MSNIYNVVDWDHVKDLSVEEQVACVSKAVALTQPINDFFRTKVLLTWVYCKYKEHFVKGFYPKIVVLPESGKEVDENFMCSTFDLVIMMNVLHTLGTMELTFIVNESSVVKNAEAFIGMWEDLVSKNLE